MSSSNPSSSKVVVVGSSNWDICMYLSQLPTPGETIGGGRLSTNLGGKGANQAVACHLAGASTEFIALDEEGDIKYSFSLPVGSVRSTNWLEKNDFKSRFEAAVKPFMERLDNVHAPLLHCVAGTLTSLANMHLKNKDFVENDVHGHILCMEDVVNLVDKYSSSSPEDFLSEFPFLGKRSHAIRGGLILTKTLGELVKVKEFKVSTYGLRYGTLLEGCIEEKYVH